MAFFSTLAVFVSAFLLFAVQPMVAKMLLPNLGGAPAVWNTAMVFYQGALLLGYLYAHTLAQRLAPKAQLVTHLGVLVLPFLVLPLGYANLHPPTTSNPAPWMLLTMAASVGLPFFVLSATSPLVQAWFARAGGGDPYHLYAASNVGSFAGLLAYPLLIEPNWPVDLQSQRWTIGYVAFVVVLVGLAATLAKRPLKEVDAQEESEELTWRRRLKWVFLAFVPSSHFIGATTFLTTDIAVMPLLWVLPLGIYLLTMVIVFARRTPIPHRWVVAAFPVALAAITWMTVTKFLSYRMFTFGAHLVLLFLGALLCHGELAKDRPKPARLTEFFLWMSLGGVLGGVFNALIAPAIFVRVFEYGLVLALAGLALPFRGRSRSLAAAAWDLALPIGVCTAVFFFLWARRMNVMEVPGWLYQAIVATACVVAVFCSWRPLRFATMIGGLLAISFYNASASRQTLFAGRSFFGVYRVDKVGTSHELLHGKIMHGEQIMEPGFDDAPLSYYHPLGPLKEVFADWKRPPGARVAAVGLGSGSVCLWSQPGEHWTFFEIDPLVERIARDPSLFVALKNAKGMVDVDIGDARLRLAQRSDRFDLIVVDAFSSDAIPAHLMTLEAFRMYAQRLKPQGFMAVHISNKFLRLEPLVAAICAQLGWVAYTCDENRYPVLGPMVRGRTESTWMAVGPPEHDWSPFQNSVRWKPAESDPKVRAWTDGYSSLVPVLRPGAFKLR
jgi:hypothetical protein